MVAPNTDGQVEGQLSLVDETEGSSAGSMSALIAPPPHTDERPPAIRSVRMRSFKSFPDCTVTLGAFNVLAGANNAGKSTLLQAIDLVFALLKIHAEGAGDRLALGRLVPPTVLPVATPQDLWFERRVRSGNDNIYCEVGLEFSDESRVMFGLRNLYGGINSRVREQTGMAGSRLTALLARPALWVPSATGVVRDEEYRTPARRAALISAGRHNEVVRNLLVELRKDRPEEFTYLQQLLEDRFGASIAAVSFNETLDQFVSTEYTRGAVSHDLYSAGSGFVQIVQLLSFILTRDAGIVLLDEPDAHLHSALQRTIGDLFSTLSVERGFQVVIATHSKEIINSVDPSNLVLIEPGATRVEVGSDAVTPMTVLQSLGDIDNVDAYALIRNRRCLFVEGPKDREIFSRFAATLRLRLFTGDDRIVTLAVGGSTRIEHIEQLDVIESLIGRKVASLEVRDRDGRTDEVRTVAIGDRERPLHILQRDCIESYLMDPAVIARVITTLSEQRGKAQTPSVDEIAGVIDQTCDEIRDVAIDRLTDRSMKDAFAQGDRNQTVTKSRPAMSEWVEARWSDLDSRLEVLPGKLLMSKVLPKIQQSYGVSFGTSKIAEAFTASDIPAELVQLLDQISELTAAEPDVVRPDDPEALAIGDPDLATGSTADSEES
ncbi:ATP-dependent nuclease [Patulibacter medicamentivorans]|nr:ATP-binding protein [Patulibacter medicamentivorans]